MTLWFSMPTGAYQRVALWESCPNASEWCSTKYPLLRLQSWCAGLTGCELYASDAFWHAFHKVGVWLDPFTPSTTRNMISVTTMGIVTRTIVKACSRCVLLFENRKSESGSDSLTVLFYDVWIQITRCLNEHKEFTICCKDKLRQHLCRSLEEIRGSVLLRLMWAPPL